MHAKLTPARIGYFGKIPGRGDFIRQAGDLPLTSELDSWLGQVMRGLGENARWKLHYDAMAPLHFVLAGPRRRHAIAGHLAPSRDRSGRRYPFLLVQTLEVPAPGDFIEQCPLMLQALWRRMGALACAAVGPDDPSDALQAIGAAEAAFAPAAAAGAAAAAAAAIDAFLATGTIASLDALLAQGEPRRANGQAGWPAERLAGRLAEPPNSSRLILALGMLLQPVLQSGAQQLGKSLALPLPHDDDARCHVAAFWMALIAPFLRRADVELALFITLIDGAPVLVVGFRGACADTLRAIIDPDARDGQQIDFADTAWIDEQLGVDIDVRALASYLDQSQLPLRLARELFLQTFVGTPPDGVAPCA